MEGILLIDKPAGRTSQWVVQRVKRALGVPKAGHTGTLDPLATGVLPVALGEGTKAVPFLEESRKVYEVTARLGVVTDSYDADGQVVETRDFSTVSAEKIQQALQNFSGEILQRPPIFSAVKVGGRPLYRYARSGQTVERTPRSVQIHRVEILNFFPPDFTLRIECSRGTYVRSLIYDLGMALDSGATVTALRRLASGPFLLESSIPLERLTAGEEIKPGALWSLSQCLNHLPQLDLTDAEEVQRVRQGLRLRGLTPRLAGLGDGRGRVLLSHGGRVLAVLQVEKSGDFRFLRVFS
jgi:tRNA pseudouridine55 synthase